MRWFMGASNGRAWDIQPHHFDLFTTGHTKKAARRAAFSLEQSGLEFLDVGRLRALLALGNFEAHALVLVQRAESTALDGGVMDEEISPTFVGGDETEALLSVEPLDGALSHDCFLHNVW
jgi:hypothetical protein